MPLPQLAAAGIMAGGSILSGILQNRKKRQTTTTTPTMDPAFQGMRDQILRRMTSRLGQSSQMAQGVGNRQIAGANQVFDNLGAAQRDRLASSGQLGGNVEQAGRTGLDIARGGAITDILNQLPLMQEQMDQDNIRLGSGVLSMGRGSRTVGEQPANLAGGIGAGLDDFGSFLGTMFANKGNDPNGQSDAWHRWLMTALQGAGGGGSQNSPALGRSPNFNYRLR